MNTTCKKSIAVLLVLLQLVVLLPFTVVEAQAADNQPAAAVLAAEQQAPYLNKVYTGAVQFGTFNFTSSVGSKEAADYVMPYVYTDDYFAAPSYDVNVTPSAKTLNWTALEDKSLATASMDFTMACFGSNEEITSAADYTTNYDKNGVQFLEAIDFEHVESNSYTYDASKPLTKENSYNAVPTKDSIGVIVGSKEITVWTGSGNETYTLVAVGVRGAGYGAEWASNLTLGPSGEHQGFREAANKVEYKLDDYMRQYGINPSDHVKFWVVGYSRAGAVANLVAGDLSGSKYNVAKTDVYGYTFESAAGADISVDPNGKAYPNIHNILSRMDAVPRVSSGLFGNNRLGVDYIVPYYNNEQYSGQNAAYYNRMYSILKTVATGYFDEDGAAIADPVLTDADPQNYPVNGTIQVQTFGFDTLITNSSELGASPYTGRWGNQPAGTDIGTKSGSYYYIQLDQYLDSLVNMILSSKAWDQDPSKIQRSDSWTTVGYAYGNNDVITVTNPMRHRYNFATKLNGQEMSYQDAMRYLVGTALGTPGAKLTDMLDSITDNIVSKLVAGAGLIAAVNGPLGDGYDDHPDENHAAVVDSHVRDMILKVLGEINLFQVSSNKYTYYHAGSLRIHSSTYDVSQQTGNAVATLSPALTRLFLYDRNNFGSQYLGTLLKYALSTILVTHTPELDVSWQMAMDENYVNSYRTIELSKTADVKMYAFREGFEGALPEDADAAAAAQGALVASFADGTLATTDQRIAITADNGSTVTLRYPGTMDYRFDITGSTDGLQVTDLQPVTAVNAMAHYDRAANGNIIPDSRTIVIDGPDGVTQPRNGASAQALNARTDLTVAEGETLSVMAWHGTNSLDKTQKENTYDAVKTFSVTFDANKGEGTMAPMKMTAAGAALTPNAFTRDAYDFTGWNTAPDGSGTAYADGEQVNLTASTTLYAQWKVQTYTVDLYFRAPGIADKLGGSANDYPATKSMKLTASETYTTGGKTYYFDHWEFGVDENTVLQYPNRIVTIRPSQGGSFTAYAVYSETQKTDFTPFVMIIRDETVGGKLVKTLTYSLPDGYALQPGSVGFKVYDGDGQVIGRAFSANLTGATGTYTVTVVNPDDDIRVVGEVTYVKDDNAQTITAETKGVIS